MSRRRTGTRDEVAVTTGDDGVVAARGSGDVVLQAASGAMGDGVKSRGTGVWEEGIEQERPSSVRRRVCGWVRASWVAVQGGNGGEWGIVWERVGRDH